MTRAEQLLREASATEGRIGFERLIHYRMAREGKIADALTQAERTVMWELFPPKPA